MEFESLRAAGTSVRCVPCCAETGATLSTLPKPMVSETLRSRLCTAISDVGGLGEIDVRSYYHMSGMSSLLHILVYREASSHHEPNEKGERPLGMPPSRRAVPLSIISLREESWVAWRDAQYAAHFAHAVDPWVLDAGRRARI